ncbi:unnamed protein product [Ceutorhynchus assimilis]|uniref:Intraflagellar transport protein 122 homolog n=1 Tax=Ceutorhynchus assimilis TaxID=467358 RepID=A0A9N9MFU4_9CUCU|nr:unnamed protein product [Ceutorhynchus assimilis]
MVIYELYSKDSTDMHYRAKEKIPQKIECSLLVVCSNHLIICQENTLQSLLFSGEKEKSWTFSSPIRYIKNIGGPAGKEGLLLGLKNGQAWQVHLDNVHPLLKQTINSSIRCLDLSRDKSKLALVDETGLMQIFKHSTLCYQEHNVNSVAFNTHYEEMLAYSGTNDTLSLKILDFPSHIQKLSGFVVGLTGSKVFCLNGSNMNTIELPLSTPMYQFLEKNQFKEAYKVACLGVTDGDWEELAHTALEHLDLKIARLAFVKLQNFNYLELIQEISHKQLFEKEVILGDILAMKGKFKEAARLYQKSGNDAKALTMYTDLRMFDEAQEFLGNKDNKALIRQKADWAKNINEPKAAADMYISIGDIEIAIEIYFEQQWSEQLIQLGRQLDKSSTHLSLVAQRLQQLNQKASAAEIYRRLGDSLSVLKLHIEANEWPQAFSLIQNQPNLSALVYVPYAQYLAENDQFVKAQKAFHKAGKSQEAFKVFRQLTSNAVDEMRFDDASFYYWIISRQYLDLNCLEDFRHNQSLAEIYYAYQTIHKYLEEPFTSYMPEALFNISRFLVVEIGFNKPQNISQFAIIFTLAKQASKLGANKLANQLYDKLQYLKIPKKFEEQLEIAAIASKSKPYRDPEELLPMCYRCSTYNPALTNFCTSCKQQFVYSFVSFELLPLVEFKIEANLTDDEAVRLIQTPHKRECILNENVQTLELASDTTNFAVILSKQELLELEPETVLVCKWGPPLKYQFYRNVLPELNVTVCNSCFKAFHVDDFELQLLQKGFCPFCRVAPDSVDLNDDFVVE